MRLKRPAGNAYDLAPTGQVIGVPLPLIAPTVSPLLSASSTHLRALRNHFARGYIKRRLARREVSLVSDDCRDGRRAARSTAMRAGLRFEGWN